MTDDDLQKKKLEALMEEYKTLRTESLNTINNRISIMGFSFASLALVGTVTVSTKTSPLVISLILGLVLPLMSKTVTLVWIGEYQRSQRAGVAIALLEREINKFFDSDTLTWENTLRRKATKLVMPYESSIQLFLYIGSISKVIAVYYFGAAVYEDTGSEIFSTAFAILFAVLLIHLEIMMRYKINDAWLKARIFASHDGVQEFERLKLGPNLTDPTIQPTEIESLRLIFRSKILGRHTSLNEGFVKFEVKMWKKIIAFLDKNEIKS